MSAVFADTGFWIAILNPRDSLHEVARRMETSQPFDHIVTTEMVLTELLNDLGARGLNMRLAASRFLAELRTHARVSVIPQTSGQFWTAAKVYHERTDKVWSLTDCASFVVMQEQGIHHAFTYDRHFE